MEPARKRSVGEIFQLSLAIIVAVAAPILLVLSLWYVGQLWPPGQQVPLPGDQPIDAGQPQPVPAVEPAVETGTIEVNDGIPDEDYPAPVQTAARQTVPVCAIFFNGENGYGTGFLLRPGVVVTAAHILDAQGYDNLESVVVYCGDRNVVGSVLAFDRLRDTAVIDVDCAAAALPLDQRQLNARDKLYATGFNYRPQRTAVDRFLRPTWPKPKAILRDRGPGLGEEDVNQRVRDMARLKVPRLQAIDVELVPGNSGSAVVGADGAVVGMAVVVDRILGVSFIVPAVNIRHVLDEAGVK